MMIGERSPSMMILLKPEPCRRASSASLYRAWGSWPWRSRHRPVCVRRSAQSLLVQSPERGARGSQRRGGGPSEKRPPALRPSPSAPPRAQVRCVRNGGATQDLKQKPPACPVFAISASTRTRRGCYRAEFASPVAFGSTSGRESNRGHGRKAHRPAYVQGESWPTLPLLQR